MSQVIVFSATNGNNLKLANKLCDIASDMSQKLELINIEDLNLPLYTPKKQKEGMPDGVIGIKEKLMQAKGFVICAPEYNGSIPPVVTNLIAWISVGADKNWREAFNGKFAVVATHSGSGGMKYYFSIRTQLEHLGTIVLPRPILTNYQKELAPESAQAILQQIFDLCS